MHDSVPSFLSSEVVDIFEFVHIPLFKDREFLYQKYVVERLSPEEIAAEISSCRTTVSKHLKVFKVPLRKADRTRSQLGYGETWRNRQIAFHKREQEIITKMRELRATGWSYWKIADVLNVWKIPTKTQRGKWHARSVQQILDREVISLMPVSNTESN